MPVRLAPVDRAHLARAIALAEAGRRIASPNPAVGCVLAHGERVVGEGTTQPVGGAHAEAVALAAAGAQAHGATAYVTLEPCAHWGRTAPCADALADAGVARVVVAIEEANGLAAGGVGRLRLAGTEVVVLPTDDLYATTVAAQLDAFRHVVESSRPHVTVKLAQTADGRLTVPGSRWITSAEARLAVHRWRAVVDAVLVGSGTVLADDPGLDARDVPVVRQPVPVVVDARLRTPPGAAVVGRGAIVVTATAAPDAARAELAAAGATLLDVPAAAGGGVDLSAALRRLAGEGITSVLAEPGPTLAQALLDEDLVDRLVLHVAGAGAERVAEVRSAVALGEDAAWRLERAGGAGPDLVHQLVRDRGHDLAGARAA